MHHLCQKTAHFFQGKPQIGVADFNDLPSHAQASERKRWIIAGDDGQVHVNWHMFEEETQRLVNLHTADQMVIIQHQGERAGRFGQEIDQPREYGFDGWRIGGLDEWEKLLTNVGRHASARACLVRISRDEGLEVTVADDGVGIAADAPAGVGLLAIRERAAELGGTVTVGPGPEGGAQVTVRIPLSPQEAQSPQEAEEPHQLHEARASQEVSLDAAAGADR